MDVGESPVNETNELCGATHGQTMSLCSNPPAMREGPDGKLIAVTRRIEGGNKGTGFSVPLCEQHLAMWDKDPSSLVISVPPSPILPNLRRA